jgi:hypothetical protein
LSVEAAEPLANEMQTFHHFEFRNLPCFTFWRLAPPVYSFLNFPSYTLKVTTLKLGEALFSKPSSILKKCHGMTSPLPTTTTWPPTNNWQKVIHEKFSQKKKKIYWYMSKLLRIELWTCGKRIDCPKSCPLLLQLHNTKT